MYNITEKVLAAHWSDCPVIINRVYVNSKKMSFLPPSRFLIMFVYVSIILSLNTLTEKALNNKLCRGLERGPINNLFKSDLYPPSYSRSA